MVLSAEKKEKEVNEAEALNNLMRIELGFNDAVKKR